MDERSTREGRIALKGSSCLAMRRKVGGRPPTPRPLAASKRRDFGSLSLTRNSLITALSVSRWLTHPQETGFRGTRGLRPPTPGSESSPRVSATRVIGDDSPPQQPNRARMADASEPFSPAVVYGTVTIRPRAHDHTLPYVAMRDHTPCCPMPYVAMSVCDPRCQAPTGEGHPPPTGSARPQGAVPPGSPTQGRRPPSPAGAYHRGGIATRERDPCHPRYFTPSVISDFRLIRGEHGLVERDS